MKKDSKTLKANKCKTNPIKIEPALIESWLAKNSGTAPVKNKIVGISECPAPWG